MFKYYIFLQKKTKIKTNLLEINCYFLKHNIYTCTKH